MTSFSKLHNRAMTSFYNIRRSKLEKLFVVGFGSILLISWSILFYCHHHLHTTSTIEQYILAQSAKLKNRLTPLFANTGDVPSGLAVGWELRSAQHMCWKAQGGNTRVTLAKKVSVDRCARLAYENKKCGIGFDHDSSDGFCGCGATGTTNDQCTTHVQPQKTTNIYHYVVNTRLTEGKLSCSKYGGPSDESAQEMVYWYDIPTDSRYKSPFLLQEEEKQKKHHEKKKTYKSDKQKYLIFEPDIGGFNNVRMSMEIHVVLAAAMGRILVLPPTKRHYLLSKEEWRGSTQQEHFGFADFFPMKELTIANDAIPNMITTDEFLTREAMTGHLIDKDTKKPSFPPHNRTDWDGREDYDKLATWLRTVSYIPEDWRPKNCLVFFPKSATRTARKIEKLTKEVIAKSKKKQQPEIHYAQPNGTNMERLRESLKGRNNICLYNETMQKQNVINFGNHRTLAHVYTFLFFGDWKEDLWTKRLVRDHLRYTDEIQCAAARIVHAMRKVAQRNDPKHNPNGEYDAFHIRRGDFQFREAQLTAEQILEISNDELPKGTKRTVFIATDERDKAFFKPFLHKFGKKHFVHFLDDFIDPHLSGVNTNYYGMIDQLVASKSRIFFGVFWSTFTGYIMRMRGYRSVHEHREGYENGILPTTYYYAPKNKKFDMHDPNKIIDTNYQREFPQSWRNIDFGV